MDFSKITKLKLESVSRYKYLKCDWCQQSLAEYRVRVWNIHTTDSGYAAYICRKCLYQTLITLRRQDTPAYNEVVSWIYHYARSEIRKALGDTIQLYQVPTNLGIYFISPNATDLLFKGSNGFSFKQAHTLVYRAPDDCPYLLAAAGLHIKFHLIQAFDQAKSLDMHLWSSYSIAHYKKVIKNLSFKIWPQENPALAR